MITSLFAILNLMVADVDLPIRVKAPIINATQKYVPEKTLMSFAGGERESVLLKPVAPPTKTGQLPVKPVEAARAILLDFDSAKVLYEKNADEPAAVASLTKLMTALVAIDLASSHDQILTVPAAINNLEADSSVADLEVGQKFTVDSLLKAMMVASGNDAALSLAIGLSGSEDKFVHEMNIKAGQMGLQDTLFANVTGLDDPQAHSTARDIAFLLMQAQKNELLGNLSRLSSATVYDLAGDVVYLRATDKLLTESDLEVVSAKTGFTDLAGQSFAVEARRAGHDLVAVVLDSPDRFKEAERLLNLGFDNYSWLDSGERFSNQKGVRYGG